MALTGTLAEETFDFDGGRRVGVYLPAQPPTGVVFAADGQAVPRWAATLEASDAPPTAIVGVHGLPDEMDRLAEYSPVFDAARFAAHETFLVDDVRAWVHDRFGLTMPPARTAIFGASAGGELALALGIAHPEVFGAILSGSPGAGYRPPQTLPTPPPRTYLVAGTLEPFFLDNATRWANALRDAGTEVILAERRSDHRPSLWRRELPRMVSWAFG